MALGLIAVALGAAPTGEAELVDAALEASRTIRRCVAQQALGEPCSAEAAVLARASITVALASSVVRGEPDQQAIADAWALEPSVMAPWHGILGTSPLAPSPWVLGVLDPSTIVAAPPPPRSNAPFVPADPEDPQPGWRPLPPEVEVAASWGTLAAYDPSYATNKRANLPTLAASIRIPIGLLSLRSRAAYQVITWKDAFGDTRSATGGIDLVLPLTLSTSRSQTLISWCLGPEGWTDGSSREQSANLRRRLGLTVPARWGLGLHSAVSLTSRSRRFLLGIQVGHALLHRWFPRHHLQDDRGPALDLRARTGWVVDLRLQLGAHLVVYGPLTIGITMDSQVGSVPRVNDQAGADLAWGSASPRGSSLSWTLRVGWRPGFPRT